MIIGEPKDKIQIQFKDGNKSLSFTVKNIPLNEAYSKTLCLFKRLVEAGDEDITLTLYNTKARKELEREV